MGVKIRAMATYTEEEINKIKAHCANNSVEILNSASCSCLFCRHTYEARKISDWDDSDGSMSAICPECGMPYAVGDASGYIFDKDDLREINRAIFGSDFMVSHPEAARAYVHRYAADKITHKPENEALYVKYLTALKDIGDADAAFALGDFYQFRSRFSPLDHRAAFEAFSAPVLSTDPESLDRIGSLYLEGMPKNRKDSKMAFIAFSKSAAAGCPFGIIHYYDCYIEGHFVPKDIDYGMSEITHIFGECADYFSRSENCSALLPMAACRLARELLRLSEQRKDLYTPFYFALYADYAFASLASHDANSSVIKEEKARNDAIIQALQKTLGVAPKNPVLDQDTFADSTSFAGIPHGKATRFFLGTDAVVPEGDFDPDKHAFSFTIRYSSSPIIVDLDNSFLSKGPDEIRWDFREVESVEFDYGKPFNIIETDPNKFRFLSVRDGVESLVGTISLFPIKKGGKKRKPKTSKGGHNQA